MIRKTLIAVAAASAIALSFGATSAKADGFDIGFGFGPGGFLGGSIGFHGGGYGHHHGFYDTGYYDDGGDCHYVMVKQKHWNWSHTFKIITWSKQLVCY